MRASGSTAAPSTARALRRRTIAVWAGFAAVWAWLAFRMYRGAADTRTGDFNDFYFAAMAMRDGLDVYASGRGGYLYPPLIAWLLQPIAAMGQGAGAIVWGCVNLGLSFLSIGLLFRIVSRALGGPRDPMTAGAVLLLATALTFEPIRSELEHGQTDAVVLLGLSVALAIIDRFPTLAGGALGLALMVKHHAIVVLFYLLVRRRWRTAVGTVLGGVALAFLPAVQLGLARTAEYLAQSYGYLFRLFGGEAAPEGVNLHPITWELSISVTSAIARLLDGPRGPPMTGVGGLTLLVAAGVFGATWWIYRRQGVAMFARRGGPGDLAGQAVVVLEWCGVIIALLAFSPQSITRHTYILLPVHVLAAYVLLVRRPGAVKWPLAAGVIGYQLAARLPPGEEAFRPALEAWRFISGAAWFLLLMWLGLVWSTLSFARADQGMSVSGQPSSAPEPASG